MNTDVVDEAMNKHKAMLSPSTKARGLSSSATRKKQTTVSTEPLTNPDSDMSDSKKDPQVPNLTVTSLISQLEDESHSTSSEPSPMPSYSIEGVNVPSVGSATTSPDHRRPLSLSDHTEHMWSISPGIETETTAEMENSNPADNKTDKKDDIEDENKSTDGNGISESEVSTSGGNMGRETSSSGNGTQPDSTLVLKMFSDMEKLESAITPALSKSLECEVGNKSSSAPGEHKSDEIGGKARKLRKQEEFKKEVLNLKAAIQQMKTGQNEMKTFLNEINSMNDNLNAVRDMIKLQEFQKRLQSTKNNAKVPKTTQPAMQPSPEVSQKHSTAFNGVMKSILNNSMLNASLKENASSIVSPSVSPSKKNAYVNRVATTSQSAKTPPGRNNALAMSDFVVGEITSDNSGGDNDNVPPPPQSYSPFRVIEKKRDSLDDTGPQVQPTETQDKPMVSADDKEAENDIICKDDNESRVNIEDIKLENKMNDCDTKEDGKEHESVDDSDSDSDNSDLQAPTSRLMMSPSRVHQAILFDSSPLQKEGFEQVEARIAAEEQQHGQHENDTVTLEKSGRDSNEVQLQEEKEEKGEMCEESEQNVKNALDCNNNAVERENDIVDLTQKHTKEQELGQDLERIKELLQEQTPQSTDSIQEEMEQQPQVNEENNEAILQEVNKITYCESRDELKNSECDDSGDGNLDDILKEIPNIRLGSSLVTDENVVEEVANVELKSSLVEVVQDTESKSESKPAQQLGSEGKVSSEMEEDKPMDELKDTHTSSSLESSEKNSDANRIQLKHQLSLALQATRESLHHVEGAPVLPPLDIHYNEVTSEDMDDADASKEDEDEDEQIVPENKPRPAILKHQLSRQLQATRRSLKHVEGASKLPPIDTKYSDSEDDVVTDGVDSSPGGVTDDSTKEYDDINGHDSNGDNDGELKTDKIATNTESTETTSRSTEPSVEESQSDIPLSNDSYDNTGTTAVVENAPAKTSPRRSSAYKSLFGVIEDEDMEECFNNEGDASNYSGDDEDDDENERDDVFVSEVGIEPRKPQKPQHHMQPDARSDFHKINILIALYSPYFYITECPHKRFPFRETSFKASESTICLLWAVFQCYTKNESDVISRSMKVTYLLHMLRDAGLLQHALSTSAPVKDTAGATNQNHRSAGTTRRESVSRKTVAFDQGPLDWATSNKESVYGALTPTTSNRIALELERLNKLDSTMHASSANLAVGSTLNNSISSTTSKGSISSLQPPKPTLEHVVSTSSNISFVVFTELMFSLTGLCFPDFDMSADENCPSRHSWKYDDFLRLHFLTPFHQIPSGFFDLPSTQLLARLAHLLLVGTAGVNSSGLPSALPSGMFTSPFPKYTPKDAQRIFVEKGYSEVDAGLLSTPFQEDSVFAIAADGYHGKSGLGMYGLWEHNIEQMKSVYAFYAHGVTASRRESITANSMKTAQSAMQKSRNAIEAASVSTSRQKDTSMLDFEKIKALLQNFQVYPKHVDLKTVQALFQYTKQWEWTWAENKLSVESPSASSDAPKTTHSPMKQNRRNVRASISFLALERDQAFDSVGVPPERLASKKTMEKEGKSAIPVTAKDLKKCEASTLMTFRGFIEFLTRLSLYIHVHNLEHNSQTRQRGNMKARDGGSSQQQQYQLKMEVLGTAIGFLLRLMDNSTGKKIIMGASRRGSVAIKNFIYK
eukprot:CAMPEP_0114437652 /NCGR_PEP_ID=MMETSP0103-20121206/14137_1 /TAXON_ID=37642 ORGANISM="Paraphysomonas imperforata, Strain PA2" /NCGR_SAMPLE_ID=MMETSP0103 /ASSEMBLY_ACC=CAM_ASM_000201 /LENGTH=1680 /DNA_ID=CAMNT_0001608077 /DNA_START=273 /DNA_END=5315 /DNA_ORIENTATION=-